MRSVILGGFSVDKQCLDQRVWALAQRFLRQKELHRVASVRLVLAVEVITRKVRLVLMGRLLLEVVSQMLSLKGFLRRRHPLMQRDPSLMGSHVLSQVRSNKGILTARQIPTLCWKVGPLHKMMLVMWLVLTWFLIILRWLLELMLRQKLMVLHHIKLTLKGRGLLLLVDRVRSLVMVTMEATLEDGFDKPSKGCSFN